MSKTAGDIIAAKRKDFSLNRLEDITGMNRSSILRYQRNEARIPEDVAEKLARQFFKRKADIEIFISLCQKGYELTEGKIREGKRRRAERSRASREFRGEIRVMETKPDTLAEIRGNKMIFPRAKRFTIEDVHFIVAIISKKSGQIVCTLSPKEGITMCPGSGYRLGEISPKEFLMFQSRRRPSIGKYALLDIMERTIEESDVFSFGTDDTGNLHEGYVVISVADLTSEEERLKSIIRQFDSLDGSDIHETLEAAIAHLQFWKRRASIFKARKKELLRAVDNYCKRIAALSQKS